MFLFHLFFPGKRLRVGLGFLARWSWVVFAGTRLESVGDGEGVHRPPAQTHHTEPTLNPYYVNVMIYPLLHTQTQTFINRETV